MRALYEEALLRLDFAHESRFVETRFGRTHVIVAGPEDGPPVLVLPGGNFLNPLCLAWFAPLARRYRVFAPDIVGQPGRSAQRRLSPKGDEQALWTAEVLDGLGLVEAAFVGVSYGAGLILRLAGYAPLRITRAALVSPAGVALGSVPRMLMDVMLPMLAYRLRPSPARLRRAARPILTDLDDLYLRQLGAIYRGVRLDRGLPRLATEQELSILRAPVMLFTSEDDPFFPGEKVIARAREIVPNLVAAELLKGCRHVPSWAALDSLDARLFSFLSEAEGRGAV